MTTRAAGRIDPADARRCHRPLLAYDGSPGADLALDFAIELASAAHGRLTVLTATPQIPFLAYSGPQRPRRSTRCGGPKCEMPRLPLWGRESHSAGRLRDQDLQPALGESVLREAATGKHDLLILGSRGRGVIRSALLGSLGRDMLRLSPLPVLIVGPSAEPSRKPEAVVANPVSPMTPRSA